MYSLYQRDYHPHTKQTLLSLLLLLLLQPFRNYVFQGMQGGICIRRLIIIVVKKNVLLLLFFWGGSGLGSVLEHTLFMGAVTCKIVKCFCLVRRMFISYWKVMQMEEKDFKKMLICGLFSYWEDTCFKWCVFKVILWG